MMLEVQSGDLVSGVVKPSWQARMINTAKLADGVHEFHDGVKYRYLAVANSEGISEIQLRRWRKNWVRSLGVPSNYEFEHTCDKLMSFSHPSYDAELHAQANAPGDRYQKMLLLLPKNGQKPYPVVVVPFYTPSWLIGFDPETGVEVPKRDNDPYHRLLGQQLAEQGFAVLTAEAYHITYRRTGSSESGFGPWQKAAEALRKDHPHWSGIGKLVADTQLMLDYAQLDDRLDAEKIAVMGHSLGGKMAFYTGCFDDRVKSIVASDWGIGWHQTNWQDPWYWGEQLPGMIASGMEHSQLLSTVAPKPLMILAGSYDDEGSGAFLKAAGRCYGEDAEERLRLIHHAKGHLIPQDVLLEAVAFMHRW